MPTKEERQWTIVIIAVLALILAVAAWVAVFFKAAKLLDDGPAHRPSEFSNRR